MRITPLEIKRKTFEKKLRGFDKDEVNAFLVSLSQEWERLLNENNELKIKQETKATIRCVPLEGDIKSGTCIYSGNPSKQQVIFAKSY